MDQLVENPSAIIATNANSLLDELDSLIYEYEALLGLDNAESE